MREAADRLYGGHKNFLLQRRYGIDETELNRMIEAQGGLCAICQVKPAAHVDHCHTTGKVRGVLCFNCNGGLGRFEDDPEVMRRAIEYLVAHGCSY
ncbi:MAG: endonuclease VII domain-containing protein [Actinomycetota bacterium]|nr:endonuclease VII domain-containing protein [Actinomycetota bacterium]